MSTPRRTRDKDATPPLAVQALLALANCSAEFVPHKWHRGARRKAYWRVWHTEERLGVFVLSGEATFEKWQWVVSKILRGVHARQDQTGEAR